ncbi:hypothetical protein M513_04541 [Trichuris suis]|uniref:EGF-like domain-containing protein n=2 Tax=Trichuris suis TaxID=68888 RepID=A0A085MBK0_9BILA|nr:hypothetical protein M513_04541 [Trichuris suis]
MTLRALLRTVIFIQVTTAVLSSTSDRCPSDAGMGVIGYYRKEGECISFTKIPPTEMWKRAHAITTLDTVCNKKFKEGKRYGFLYDSDIQHNEAWRRNLAPMHCMGHFVLLSAYDYRCVYEWTRIGDECNFKVTYSVDGSELHATFRHYVNYFKSTFYGDWSDKPLMRFQTAEYFRFLLSTRYPACPTYEMHRDGYHEAGPVDCLDSSLWGGKYHVACIHKPYANCNYTKKEYCHYHEYDQKWYQYIVHIVKSAETPYGIACPPDIPKEWKNECSPTCRGTWGPWSSEPSQKNLRCDTVILERFRPAREGDPECSKVANDCCLGRKIVQYNASCTDFAFNQTINLKRERCKNGGTLGRDSRGHLMCMCTDRYDGIQCERDVCEGKCKHGGTCIPGRGKPQCICRKGFKGSDCEVVAKSCGSNGICENGGTCDRYYVAGEEAAYCKCKDGYGGPACEHSVEKCTDASCNSNGLCTDDSEYGSIKCTCYDGYKGDNCEYSIKLKRKINRAMQPTFSNVLGLVIGLLLGFVLLTFCFGGAVIHHRRRRRRRHGRSSDSSLSSYISSRASTFSTTISTLFGRTKSRAASRKTVKSKKADTRSVTHAKPKNVGISKHSH